MQVAGSARAISPIVLAVGLGLLIGTPASPQGAPNEGAKAKKAQSNKKPKASSTDEARPASEQQAKGEPALVVHDKLPKEIRVLHICAVGTDTVEVTRERYATVTLFVVSCPMGRGHLGLSAVYVARDAAGRGAKRVIFEVPPLKEGEAAATMDLLPSAAPAREVSTRPEDLVRNAHTRNDVTWVSGAWRPDDRPGVCAVSGHWRLKGDKAQLWYWEEAQECPKDALPKYQVRVDKSPPVLVGR